MNFIKENIFPFLCKIAFFVMASVRIIDRRQACNVEIPETLIETVRCSTGCSVRRVKSVETNRAWTTAAAT